MLHLAAALCCGMPSASAAWPSCSTGLAVPQVGIGLESRQGTPVATTREGSLPRSARLISNNLVQTVCVLQAAWCYLHEDAVAVFSRAREPYFFHRGGIVAAVVDTAAALGASGRLATARATGRKNSSATGLGARSFKRLNPQTPKPITKPRSVGQAPQSPPRTTPSPLA